MYTYTVNNIQHATANARAAHRGMRQTCNTDGLLLHRFDDSTFEQRPPVCAYAEQVRFACDARGAAASTRSGAKVTFNTPQSASSTLKWSTHLVSSTVCSALRFVAVPSRIRATRALLRALHARTKCACLVLADSELKSDRNQQSRHV